MMDVRYLELRGSVVSGEGEGKYYLAQEEYKKQFDEKLCIDPVEGTLNIELDESYISTFDELRSCKGILIKGFEKDGEKFGSVKAFPGLVDDIKCALIIPEKTVHTSVAEVISELHIRKALGLNDGDDIKVRVFTP